jgi:hypothetical protein
MGKVSESKLKNLTVRRGGSKPVRFIELVD